MLERWRASAEAASRQWDEYVERERGRRERAERDGKPPAPAEIRDALRENVTEQLRRA